MMVGDSDAILQRLLMLHPKKIDLVLDRVMRLLADLGHPEQKLPPIIHVAGTNGKGSTCAFARAMLEAAGKRVSVYSSPHLVRFHERIRLPDGLIGEDALADLLAECEAANQGQPITFFEITTAAAFLAFSRAKADALILEVGLGGRFDATNVITPAASVITPVGLDHAEFLGTTITAIAGEKAGIIKPGVPVIVAPQTDEALEVILAEADRKRAPAFVYGQDFTVMAEHGRMVYQDTEGLLDLPPPRLYGHHQFENAASAIAALRCLDWAAEDAIAKGLQKVEWPARLQRLTRGSLVSHAPAGAEIWLDGGHNPHGAAAVARAMADFADRSPKPLYLISGMLNTKDSTGYFAAFQGLACHVETVAIAGDSATRDAATLCGEARAAGLDAAAADSLEAAMTRTAALVQQDGSPARILICGSLHLAGVVLKDNG